MAIAADSFQYNGYSFNSSSKTKVRSTPVLDDAKRMVKFLDINIDVRGYITGDAGTDQEMGSLRRTLTAPGKRLKYDSRGFGTLDVNAPNGTVFDCDWGPKPGQLTFVTLGNGVSCLFEWSVSTRIPECADSVFQKALMMGNYTLDYNIDETGLTVITCEGAIEVPLTWRNGPTVLSDSADAYREMCFPPVPLGFQRISKKFVLSSDRKRGTFSYADKEIPIPLPDGCPMADVRHRMKNQRKMVFNGVYEHEISGTIRTNPRIPKQRALDRFLTIVFSRIAAGQATLRTPGPVQVLMADSFSITENVFGLDSQFSFAYRRMANASLADAVAFSGLWRPVSATQIAGNEIGFTGDPAWTFQSYRDSLAENAHSPRGTHGAFYNAQCDTFIDLCMAARTGPVQNVGGDTAGPKPPTTPWDYEGQLPDEPPPLLSDRGPLQRLFPPEGQLPPEDGSWLVYETDLIYDQDNNIAIHKPLAGTVTAKQAAFDPTDPGANFNGVAYETGVSATVPDVTQRIGAPTVRVTLAGYAERYGYPIVPPRLIMFAGKEVEELRQLVRTGIVGVVNKVPVHRTVWAISYLVKTPPAVLPVLQNPMYNMGVTPLNLQSGLLDAGGGTGSFAR